MCKPSHRFLVALLPLFLWVTAWAQQGEVVVTKQDLVEMSAAGLPESLILKTIESADQVPALQPTDLTELVAEGVSAKVLEAVIERRQALKSGSQPAEPKDDTPPARKRVLVTARVDNKQSWFRKWFPGEKKFTVYWAAAVDEPGTGLKRAIDGCPHDEVCWCTDSDGQPRCVGPAEEIWRQYFSCLSIVEMEIGRMHDIFDFDLEGETEEVRIQPYVMIQESGGPRYLELWNTSHGDTEEAKPEREPGYVSIHPGASRDFTAEVNIGLEFLGNAESDFGLIEAHFDHPDSRAEPPEGPIRIRTDGTADLLPESLRECPPQLGPE